jgi:hypothetical protein
MSRLKNHGSEETILEIEVRGKRSVGFCKSTAQAVHAFRRLQERLRKPKGDSSPEPNAEASLAPKGALPGAKAKKSELVKPGPTDLVFPGQPRELLNAILEEEGLKRDRDGKMRTAYSLRHTYICFRLMEGADIYQIAKNCRTSVEMIEKLYATHIKTMLDASAINVRKGTIARERRSRQEQHA